MRIFLSYARRDKSKAELLARRLEQLRHEPWLDTSLSGGQLWWDEILGNLRNSDVVMPVVSQAYTKSSACTSEREYAIALNKPLLPVAIEQLRPGLLPKELAMIQVIDYSTPGEDSAIQLALAFSSIRPEDRLPDPLPPPPPVPVSYLSELSHKIALDRLDLDDQLVLVERLERALRRTDDSEEQATARDLLHRLSQRPDLYADTDRRIQRISASFRPPTASAPQSPPSADRGTIALWSARQVPCPDASSSTWWCVQLHLSNSNHLVVYRTTIFGGHQIILDNRVVARRSQFIDEAVAQVPDGEMVRTLRIIGTLSKLPSTEWASHDFFVDGQEIQVLGKLKPP